VALTVSGPGGTNIRTRAQYITVGGSNATWYRVYVPLTVSRR
jgi:PKD repeat protein